jgi:hypothetical protein
MHASAILDENVTLANGDPVRHVQEREQYALADEPRVTKVVYDGPRLRMQVALDSGPRRYLLKGVFVVELGAEGSSVYATSRGLPVSGIGNSDLEAIEDFCTSFDYQYRNLVEVDESSLTEGGLRRRAAMRNAVEQIQRLEAP